MSLIILAYSCKFWLFTPDAYLNQTHYDNNNYHHDRQMAPVLMCCQWADM